MAVVHVQNSASGAGPRLQTLPPLSLYLHIPWCVRKCPYCDFNSHEARGELPEDAYCQALIRDLETALPLIWGRKVHTVFFGGGTPSLMRAHSLDTMLSAIRARVPLSVDAEVTLEANPGTFEAQKFADFRALGINRLSIGVQSFNAAHLKALGRIHDGNEARKAVEIAQRNFDNINLDLMYGLPGQSRADAAADMETAVGFAPQHLSAYHLTIEPNTVFFRHPPQLPPHDQAADMQDVIEERLARAGYRHYETSAFAREGRACAHNRNYWEFGDYLGLGAGAHSKLSLRDRIFRQARYKQPKAYMEQALKGAPVQAENDLSAEELPFEFMMNALRLIDGIPLRYFEERTGLALTAVVRELETAEALGLIVRDHARLAPTFKGQRFLNDLLQIFLPENGAGGARSAFPEHDVPNFVSQP